MRFLIILTIILVIALPVVTFAIGGGDEGLIPCGESTDDCTYQDLFEAIDNVVDFVLFYLIVPVATIAIALAGIDLVIHGSNPGAIKKTREKFQNILIGLFLAFGAFVLIKAVIYGLTGTTGVGAALRDFFR